MGDTDLPALAQLVGLAAPDGEHEPMLDTLHVLAVERNKFGPPKKPRQIPSGAVPGYPIPIYVEP